MEIEEIEVLISQNGQVHIQVRGVKGTKCLELTRELEEALGGDILARIMSPEANLDLQQNEQDSDQQMKLTH